MVAVSNLRGGVSTIILGVNGVAILVVGESLEGVVDLASSVVDFGETFLANPVMGLVLVASTGVTFFFGDVLVVVFGFGVSVVVVFEETFSVVGVVVVELLSPLELSAS